MKAFLKFLGQILPVYLACALKSNLCILGYLLNKHLPGAESIRDTVFSSNSDLYFHGSPRGPGMRVIFPTDLGSWQYYYHSHPVDKESEAQETNGLV